jgi:hypothetical protein
VYRVIDLICNGFNTILVPDQQKLSKPLFLMNYFFILDFQNGAGQVPQNVTQVAESEQESN